MYLGNFMLGQFVPITIQCVDGNGTPTLPAAAPILRIYDQDGLPVGTSKRMPIVDRVASPGLFILSMQLDSSFAVGDTLSVVIQYRIGTDFYVKTCYFAVVGGGDVKGAIISMAFYERPQAKFLVQKLDSFRRNIVKNPRST